MDKCVNKAMPSSSVVFCSSVLLVSTKTIYINHSFSLAQSSAGGFRVDLAASEVREGLPGLHSASVRGVPGMQ